MTTNDDAFEKWRNDTPQDCCLDMTVEEELEYRLLQAWQAAKADSERQTGEMVRAISLAADAREAALESEVAELKSRWTYYQDLLSLNGFDGITHCISKYNKLQANNNDLREALERLARLGNEPHLGK